MKNWQSVLISPDTTIRKTLEIIDAAGSQLAVVVDEQRRLLGTLSDGDVRRALLGDLSMADRAAHAMNREPTTVMPSDMPLEVLSIMRRTGLSQLPVVNAKREVIGLALISDYLNAPQRDNWVVIMAGGLGTRLKELTRDTPKPMLKVGPRPLLEIVIRNFVNQGFHRFYMAVNYRAEQIEAHFGDGHSFGVDIRYLREEQRLGTAGGLSLLPECPTLPIIVINADLLTKEDFGHIVDQHVAAGAQATMAVRHFDMQVPFGVVDVHEDLVQSIAEKPIHRFLVSAGINVLSPEALDLVPRGKFFDMPELFEAALELGFKVRAQEIDGYWLDIGRMPDLERANSEYHNIFD